MGAFFFYYIGGYMKYKDFFEIFFTCCSIIGYIRFFYYVLYTRLFTDEKYIKYDKQKLILLGYFLFMPHTMAAIYFLRWTEHPILTGIGFTLLIYQLQMKQVKPLLKEE
jgi:hypothetical protein